MSIDTNMETIDNLSTVKYHRRLFGNFKGGKPVGALVMLACVAALMNSTG
jgi:hypothetical protein